MSLIELYNKHVNLPRKIFNNSLKDACYSSACFRWDLQWLAINSHVTMSNESIKLYKMNVHVLAL